MGKYMESAKITSKGQITIPIAIRRLLGVREGDKVLFAEEDGKVVIMNASASALRKAQKAFEGVAEELGIRDEQDIVNMVKEVRAERDVLYRCE